MVRRQLGRNGPSLSAVGFGAFKIGRNEGIKYAQGYDLPGEDDVARLLTGVLDAGINYVDTAPAYGVSEERLGRLLPTTTDVVVSTKVGETYENGRSTYAFHAEAVRDSVGRSLRRLCRDALDIVLVHSDGNDLEVLTQTDVVPTLVALRDEGLIRCIGFSGKTVQGAQACLAWADAIMVEYHLQDRSHESVIAEAAAAGVGVIVKKGLASGQLDPSASIEFVLNNPGVTTLVIGGLNLDHIKANIQVAGRALASAAGDGSKGPPSP
jgi:aryl-alcohol dehydrogenase-like predicted oxidoreductase